MCYTHLIHKNENLSLEIWMFIKMCNILFFSID